MGRIHLALAVLAVAGCHRELDVALTKQIQAQKLAADMRVELHRSAEAAQRHSLVIRSRGESRVGDA